ncbi:MAG: aminotransferase class I/II-fold pyridoxal phosphate-dependent enzyme [Clostridiales bacterium]
MSRIDQKKTPLFDAIKKYVSDSVVQYHVPGHKQGRGIGEFREYVGETILKMDANGMEDLDFANNPTGVIYESEKLLANAFGAENSYFIVNGTTTAVQAMIMSVCEPGNKIIIPRNAHKSTIGGIILSGAIPIYIQPEINEKYGIAMGVTVENLKNTIKENPRAKAIFITNPTYYGVSSDLKSIVRIAHRHDMVVLVDEAHGGHMSFHDDFPLTAMEVGADLSAVSMHKTAGAVTQSAVLLHRGNMVSTDRIKQVLNLTYTSSASYIILTSIDIARKQLVTVGHDMLENTLELVRYARNEINKIKGFSSFGRELKGLAGCYDFDETKLTVNVRGIGLTGYKMESVLRKKYNIQIELADLNNIMAIFTIGDIKKNVDYLIEAFKDISSKSKIVEPLDELQVPENPKMIVSPRDAFYSTKKVVKLEESEGEIAGEMIMAYPPGIPVICMGEKISKNIINYINLLKDQNCELQGAIDPFVNYIRVLGIV